MKHLYLISILTYLFLSCSPKLDHNEVNEFPNQWTIAQAWEWYDRNDWMVGTNFNPSTSINQLEFWQAETFDPETIDRELGWSADLGMNCHRVFLHNILWDQDPSGFLKRLDTYLDISDKHGIKTMFVLLDDVWHAVPEPGEQPEPMAGIHNSGWVQAPGAAILGNPDRHDELRDYIQGVIRHFENDDRIYCWDLYNEPANNVPRIRGRGKLEVKNKAKYTLLLLKKVTSWALEVRPSQPLTTGIWSRNGKHWDDALRLSELDRFMLTSSDVISFHTYDSDMQAIQDKIDRLKKYNRPLICTEYMARTRSNTFENVLPIFKEHRIAAFNWGLVAGKTNTIYPWKSWLKPGKEDPEVWFHDILRRDGTPFSQEEVDFLKKITGKGND